MAFYTYNQNNSFGVFQGDYHYIIIEADSADEANSIAENETEIYFDGVSDGVDCPCCGDRWTRAEDYDATDTPQVYGEDPSVGDEFSLFGGKTLIVKADRSIEVFGGAWKL